MGGKLPQFKGYIEVAAWKCKGGGLYIRLADCFFLKRWTKPGQQPLKDGEEPDDENEKWDEEQPPQ